MATMGENKISFPRLIQIGRYAFLPDFDHVRESAGTDDLAIW
jgi:hypothetical protein